MAKFTEKQIKNPIPTKIDSLTLAFDVSTVKTGFAFLINGKPFMTANNKPSFGDVDMVKMETIGKSGKEIKPRPKEYSTYGNRMFHGSRGQIEDLMNVVFQLKAIQDTHLQEQKAGRKKGVTIKKFNIIFESSEIPNTFGRNQGHTITGIRKLSLYVGMVMYAVADMVNLILPSFAPQAVVKLVKPTEWQLMLGFTKSPLDKKGQFAKYGTTFAKYQSLKKANEVIKDWGYKPTQSDDLADALNMALLADDLRDNLFVSKFNQGKSKNIKAIESEIAKLSNKIAEYTNKALENKNEFLDNVLWAMNANRNDLTAQEKIKHTKYVKYDLNDVRLWEFTEFFTPAQKKKYLEFTQRKDEAQKKIVSLRGEKVFK